MWNLCNYFSKFLHKFVLFPGNILLNIMITDSIPASRQGKNNVVIVCVPNPPLQEKASAEEQAKAVSMLIRVKTSGDADELLKEITDAKEKCK